MLPDAHGIVCIHPIFFVSGALYHLSPIGSLRLRLRRQGEYLYHLYFKATFICNPFQKTNVYIGIISRATKYLPPEISPAFRFCFIPNYLTIHRGDSLSFDCRLSSADIKYTLFARNGAPEFARPHPCRHVRKEDSLPLMAMEIYRDPWGRCNPLYRDPGVCGLCGQVQIDRTGRPAGGSGGSKHLLRQRLQLRQGAPSRKSSGSK